MCIRDSFYAVYRRAYEERLPLAAAEIETWLPVLAAARLAEGVPEEEERLLRIVESM